MTTLTPGARTVPGGMLCVTVMAQGTGQLVMKPTWVVRFGMTGGQPVTLWFIGGQITCHGDCAAVTVTMNEHEAEWPVASDAVQVTVVGPNGKAEPLGGAQTRLTMFPQVLDALGDR